MTDFIELIHFCCASVGHYEVEVQGSSKIYKVRAECSSRAGSIKCDWYCECKGFRFRGSCKHIVQAKNDPAYCGWQEQIAGGEVVRDNVGVARCPECNDLAIAMSQDLAAFEKESNG